MHRIQFGFDCTKIASERKKARLLAFCTHTNKRGVNLSREPPRLKKKTNRLASPPVERSAIKTGSPPPPPLLFPVTVKTRNRTIGAPRNWYDFMVLRFPGRRCESISFYMQGGSRDRFTPLSQWPMAKVSET